MTLHRGQLSCIGGLSDKIEHATSELTAKIVAIEDSTNKLIVRADSVDKKKTIILTNDIKSTNSRIDHQDDNLKIVSSQNTLLINQPAPMAERSEA